MWVEEIKHYCPKTPILLIATKSDLKKEKSAIGWVAAFFALFETEKMPGTKCVTGFVSSVTRRLEIEHRNLLILFFAFWANFNLN